jgi:hypothetical protein
MTLFSTNCRLFVIAGLVGLTTFNASGDVLQVIPEMGDLERWAVFSLGSGRHKSRASGQSYIGGDLGVAGNGKFALRGEAIIGGSVYYRSTGMFTFEDPGSITGAIYNNQDAELDNGVSEALQASEHAFDLSPTQSLPTLNLRGSESMTIVGAPGQTVVLSLRNFVLSGNATFTLEGTATTNFIINVRKKFLLSGSAHISLLGVQWNDVLFNIHGRNSSVSLRGDSVFEGILMADDRVVRLRGRSLVDGEIIARRINLRGDSRVIHPPITSP